MAEILPAALIAEGSGPRRPGGAGQGTLGRPRPPHCHRSPEGRTASRAMSSRSIASACSRAACSILSSRSPRGTSGAWADSSISRCSPRRTPARSASGRPSVYKNSVCPGSQLSLHFADLDRVDHPEQRARRAELTAPSARVDQQRRGCPARVTVSSTFAGRGSIVTRQTVQRSAPGGWCAQGLDAACPASRRAAVRASRRRAGCGGRARSRRPPEGPCRRRRRSPAASDLAIGEHVVEVATDIV